MIVSEDLDDAVKVSRGFLGSLSRYEIYRSAFLTVVISISIWFTGPPILPVDPSGFEVVRTQLEAAGVTHATADLPSRDVLSILLVGISVMWLGYSGLRAVMDVVFLESIRTERVTIRRYAIEHVGSATRLFAFRMALFVSTVVLLIGSIWLSIRFITPIGDGSLFMFAILGLFVAIAFTLHGVIDQLTTEFVVPIMLLEGEDLLTSWRRFVPTLVGNPSEFGMYVLLTWFLRLLTGIAIAVVLSLTALLVTVSVVVVSLLASPFIPEGLLLVSLGFVWLVLVCAAFASVTIPVITYFRYYALLVLGDTDRSLDLIPDQRRRVRSEETHTEVSSWREDGSVDPVDEVSDSENSW